MGNQFKSWHCDDFNDFMQQWGTNSFFHKSKAIRFIIYVLRVPDFTCTIYLHTIALVMIVLTFYIFFQSWC